MEAELKKSIEGVMVELVPGAGGIFDVKIDGRTIFLKGGPGIGSRFPESGEITRRLHEALGR